MSAAQDTIQTPTTVQASAASLGPLTFKRHRFEHWIRHRFVFLC